MSFSDEDLKRLKENIKSREGKYSPLVYVDRYDAKALLARLEAAENGMEALEGLLEAVLKDSKENCSMSGFTGAREFDARHALKAWRKAAGRS